MIPYISKLALRLGFDFNRTNSPSRKVTNRNNQGVSIQNFNAGGASPAFPHTGVILEGNVVSGNAGDGIHIEGDIPVTLRGNRAENNGGQGININR